jgi:hypothetical protein
MSLAFILGCSDLFCDDERDGVRAALLAAVVLDALIDSPYDNTGKFPFKVLSWRHSIEKSMPTPAIGVRNR